MINIGITITSSQGKNIWGNGISQNIINLYFLLKNIPKDYNVFLVKIGDDFNYSIDIEGLKIYDLNEVIEDMNILIELGVEINDYQYFILKNNGTKIIHYNCGSNYIIDTQKILFKENKNMFIDKCKPDEIWTIPQNYETNKHYFEMMYKVKNISVPFIWTPFFIEHVLENPNIYGYYKPSDGMKNITVFEPNIDILKYAMYPIIITEKLYDERKDLINKLYITNSDKIRNDDYFMSIVGMFEIQKNNKIVYENRYSIPYFLDKYTDVVLSHQIFNPLNYAYLDALYLKYPIVHNANMIKDGGYYYDGFDVDGAKEKLLFALTEHDNNLEEYDERSKNVLNRYLHTNEESIDIYDKLIINVLNK